MKGLNTTYEALSLHQEHNHIYAAEILFDWSIMMNNCTIWKRMLIGLDSKQVQRMGTLIGYLLTTIFRSQQFAGFDWENIHRSCPPMGHPTVNVLKILSVAISSRTM